MNAMKRGKFMVGAGAVIALSLLAGCSSTPGGATQNQGTKSEDNPFGVVADAPLDVVIFKGGYGDEYALYAEDLYAESYPEAEITHEGIQKIRETLQAKFVAGTPPDVIDNSGPSALSIEALLKDEQLTDLSDLLAAPSWDDPDKTVGETLLPGVAEAGTVDGKMTTLNYAYTVYGFWYNKALFQEKGWTYPETWEALLDLGEESAKEGTALFTYQGKVPSYFIDPLMAMIAKTAGQEGVVDIDNLEPGAWSTDAVKASVEAIEELVTRGYILEGSEGLSHTEAQQAWVDGEAVLIPSGSWLENEMKSTTPEGFEVTVGPTPSVTSNDKLPFDALGAASSEAFIVPSGAQNVAGGLEFLRVLLSKEAADKFSESTGSLTAVVGAGESVTNSPALNSAREAVAAAGEDTISFRFAGWYGDMYNAVSTAMGELLAGRITSEEFIVRAQDAADATASDTNVEKHTR